MNGDKCIYPKRLDTYGCGCQHNCSYCYAKSLLTFRKLWDNENPSVADIKDIEKTLRTIPRGTILRLGGMTDCFQPLERTKENTYKTIQLMNKYGIGYLIVTKSSMVAEQKYTDIMDKKLAHIQITVTTLDDELCKTYEKASPPSERVKAILKLQELGYDVAIRLSPIIEEYMDFEKLNSLGIKKALVEFLRVNSWVEKWFDIDYKDFVLKQSGYKFMRLNKKKEIISKIHIPEISVCEDYSPHYKFWEVNVNHNKFDCCNLAIPGE